MDKRTLSLLIGVLVTLVSLGVGMKYYIDIQEDKENIFSARIEIMRDSMVRVAVIADMIILDISKEANKEKIKPEEALKRVKEDGEFQTNMEFLEEQFEEAERIKGLLSNPPKKFKEVYLDIDLMYSKVSKLRDLAINPKGDLKDYTRDVKTVKYDFIVLYDHTIETHPYTEYSEVEKVRQGLVGDINEMQEKTRELYENLLNYQFRN